MQVHLSGRKIKYGASKIANFPPNTGYTQVFIDLDTGDIVLREHASPDSWTYFDDESIVWILNTAKAIKPLLVLKEVANTLEKYYGHSIIWDD